MNKTSQSSEVSDQELKSVIADFLDMGHVENIVAMFRHDSLYFEWVGEILCDERFSVRLGLSVLFEELVTVRPEQLSLAIPSLKAVLEEEEPLYRGEALSLLGTIDSEESRDLIRTHLHDENPQVREMAELLLQDEEQP